MQKTVYEQQCIEENQLKILKVLCLFLLHFQLTCFHDNHKSVTLFCFCFQNLVKKLLGQESVFTISFRKKKQNENNVIYFIIMKKYQLKMKVKNKSNNPLYY